MMIMVDVTFFGPAPCSVPNSKLALDRSARVKLALSSVLNEKCLSLPSVKLAPVRLEKRKCPSPCTAVKSAF
jgi:hypothetical protein